MKNSKKIIVALITILMMGCTDKSNALNTPSGNVMTTQSKKLDKEIIASWGRQKDYFIRDNLIIINWEKTKNILLNEKIRGGKQYHTGWLTIIMTDGRKYLVKQPEMDALWAFMKEKGIKPKGFGTE